VDGSLRCLSPGAKAGSKVARSPWFEAVSEVSPSRGLLSPLESIGGGDARQAIDARFASLCSLTIWQQYEWHLH
jgi:hypothetical protein